MHNNIVTCSFCSDSNTSQFQLVEETMWLVLTEGQFWIHRLQYIIYRGEHFRKNLLCDSLDVGRILFTVQRVQFCIQVARAMWKLMFLTRSLVIKEGTMKVGRKGVSLWCQTR